MTWKIAKIIPITNQEKPATKVTNYRPISLLSIISKIFEKVILIHLLTHVKNNNIVIPQQSDFRTKHSCIQQL